MEPRQRHDAERSDGLWSAYRPRRLSCRGGLWPPNISGFDNTGGHRPPLQWLQYCAMRNVMKRFLTALFVISAILLASCAPADEPTKQDPMNPIAERYVKL